MVTVKRHGFISPRCSLAYPATATMIPNFANSDGWSWKPPGSWNHALRAAGVRAERGQYGEQADDGGDVREHRVVAQPPVIDGEQQPHHDQAEKDRGALTLHEVELVDSLEPQALACRRVDHQQAEGGDCERRSDE